MKFDYKLYALVHQQTGCVYFRVVRETSKESRGVFFSPLYKTLKDNLRRGEPALIEAVRDVIKDARFNTTQGWQSEWHVELLGSFLDSSEAFSSLRGNAGKFAEKGFRVLNVVGIREDLYTTVYKPFSPYEAWLWFSQTFISKETS